MILGLKLWFWNQEPIEEIHLVDNEKCWRGQINDIYVDKHIIHEYLPLETYPKTKTKKIKK